MGFAKEQLMEQEERGYDGIDKVVCINCVGNYALKQFIVDKGSIDERDYCKSTKLQLSIKSTLDKDDRTMLQLRQIPYVANAFILYGQYLYF